MPIKWTAEEELKLLKVFLATGSDHTIDAKAVAKAWPTNGNEEKPSERSVRDRFNLIKRSARDMMNLHCAKKEQADKPSGARNETIKEEETAAKTPDLAKFIKKRPGTGSKRKRSGPIVTSDEEASSGEETSSGSESAVTPTPGAGPTLRARKSARVALPEPEGSDKQVDAGAKDVSEDEYDFAEERRKKKAKKAKAAARRTTQ